MNKLFIIAFSTALLFVSCQNKKQTAAATVDTTTSKPDTTKPAQKFELLCDYDSVSNDFDYQISGYKPTGDENDDNHVSLAIYSKKDKQLIQTIKFEKGSGWFQYDCSSRSYITGYNKSDEFLGGIDGDLITADFNFDGKEDFAVAFDKGYAEFYYFYLQKDGRFVEESYLNEYVGRFPELDSIQHTLTTTTIIGVSHVQTNIYKYNPEKKTYSILKSKLEEAQTDDAEVDTSAH